ncbi:MAG TPA: tRNA epoxyqueuosine(34) reductase QueG [Armatimonadota bacterium]|jgi:epoxyqueuosine reductase
MSLSDDIKSMALDAGCHAVGITNVRPFLEAEKSLARKFESGLLESSGFTPEKIHKFTHPAETYPSARSIISVAYSYLTDDMDVPPPDDLPRGFMARFARGLDYHQNTPISDFTGKLRQHFGSEVVFRFAMDTGHVVDRAAAVRAGVGSQGKNTCVYAGGYGSWVVLGEILIDAELSPDPTSPADICGECRECMKACPTGAISAPYQVDMRLCLSQATQMKGIIPQGLREKMGARIYGCDTCQSACPMNKGAKPGNIEVFHPSRGLGNNPELLPLLNMTAGEFNSRVAPTTAGWIRRTRFRRNVAVALGNIGDPIAVPSLIEALGDPEPLIRAHAAWALGRISTPGAKTALEKALSPETDDAVRSEISSALHG